MESLYFVTSNEEKVKEAEAILGTPITPFKADLEEIQSLDVKEIITVKAKKAFVLVQKPLFVDDVALEIEAWNGFPGPFVKHLLEAVGNEGILKLMENETNRNVTAKAAIGFHNSKQVVTFIGEVKGTIAKKTKGEKGWGWDPIFIPAHTHKTYAELTAEEKNAVSHRRAALEEFKKYLQQI